MYQNKHNLEYNLGFLAVFIRYMKHQRTYSHKKMHKKSALLSWDSTLGNTTPKTEKRKKALFSSALPTK